MNDNVDHYTQLTKTFPFFIVWNDDACQGNDHVRTEEEGFVFAYTRVLHGSFNSVATLYSGNFAGMSRALRRYRWEDRKVIYEDLKR